jgi:hypothetical protein
VPPFGGINWLALGEAQRWASGESLAVCSTLAHIRTTFPMAHTWSKARVVTLRSSAADVGLRASY